MDFSIQTIYSVIVSAARPVILKQEKQILTFSVYFQTCFGVTYAIISANVQLL